MGWIVQHIEHFILAWGYWAVLAGLLAENMGVPVPGETILIFASFLAYKHQHLHLVWVIVVGIAAATIGDNIGYFIGHRGGRPLLEKWKRFFHIGDAEIRAGEDFVNRRGWFAIFIARFIAGMRIVAGPIAGVLRMRWSHFLPANAAGAVVWVTTISLIGYTFGSQFGRVIQFFDNAGLALLAVVVIGAVWAWRRHRRRICENQTIPAGRI
jgi:membrane protein DedA with SNARE-associated domain